MAKDMRNGILLLLLLCYVHIVHATTHSSYSNNINVTCIESERKALLEFKGSLVDRANRLASWTTGEDCCNWAGITCNPHTGHVQKLHIRNPIQLYSDDHMDYYDYSHNYASYFNNTLGGEINPSILNLEQLNYLDLSCNNFSAIQIPTFLGSFKSLRYLNLTSAAFSGEIPPHLGNLSHLQYLWLGNGDRSNVFNYNLLSSKSLMWISRLVSLKSLDLSFTNLTESLDWWYSINMLPSSSSLSLRDCRIVFGTYHSPPLSPINLTSLVSLDLGETHPTSNYNIFFSLLNATNQLAVLRLHNNQLQDPIPINSEKLLPTLTVLDVSSNHFNSPSTLHSLCNHTNLVSLDLSGNDFQGSLPLCLWNLTSLRVLLLSYNKFEGKIPSELGHLIHLTTLDLSHNQFKSPIPSSFGQLAKLEYLDLSNNQFRVIPSTLGQLVELRGLDISYNSFTGELSAYHFEKVKSLKYLSISHNYFLSFVVTSQWVPLFQLREIHMDCVFLGPQFPPWLKTQTDVGILSMNNANISGVIPTWFMTCYSIRSLDLSNNNISMISIPPNLESLVLSDNFFTLSDINFVTNLSLKSLQLGNNLLAGNIPNDLCDLSHLFVLSLANNQLTGNIPLCFGNLRQLRVLDLANNSISGYIPSTLGNLTMLSRLHLSRNKLFGVLPSSMKNLKDLTTLDLGENQLTGTIPEWIGKVVSSLQFLRLQSNKFYGKISVHLCQLSTLQILNLAENNLVGHIPHCFGNFSWMITVDAISFVHWNYIEQLWNINKGLELKYSSNLGEVRSISLSGNNLDGEIPTELMILEGLQSLNISNNKLSGRIPKKIGDLKYLESLDLSRNQLSGPIPKSLASIDSLSFLNLSFNNLAGRIPSGSHFDTLSVDQYIYEGNIGLCGKSIARSCADDTSSGGKEPAFQKNVDEGFEMSWFYSGMGTGFGVGFVGVFGILCWKKSWRHAYFRFVETMCGKVWVTFAVRISQFQRR